MSGGLRRRVNVNGRNRRMTMNAKRVAGIVLVMCVAVAVVDVAGYYLWTFGFALWRHL
jgi:hypothetical protein